MSEQTYNIQDWGSDIDGQSQGLAFPFARINHKPVMNADNTTVKIPAGAFKFTDEREPISPIPFILLCSQKGRVKWDSIDDERPSCRSVNGSIPVQPIYADKCNNCPNSVWGAGGVKPSCDETIQVLCLDTDLKPFIIQFKGTGLDPTKKFLNRLVARAKKDELAPWHYPFTLGTAPVKKGKNEFYIPVFPDSEMNAIEAFDEETRLEIDAIRDELYGDWRASVDFGKDALTSGTPTPALPQNGVIVEDGSFNVGEAPTVAGNPFAKRTS